MTGNYGLEHYCPEHGEPWATCGCDPSDPNSHVVSLPADRADGAEWWAAHTAAGGGFVLDAPAIPPAVWGDGNAVAWAQGESLMLCGPAGVGKTTLGVQLLRARLGIGDGIVLGMPVRAGDRRSLYLAMDRPPQVSRAMRRLFTDDDRGILDKRLVVWKGPPPYDLAKRPDTILQMCKQADADTVFIDSLKDGVLKLSDDEQGGGYNRARQMALVAGIEVVENHHQRKAGGENKKPSKLDDVYGSTWLTAGAGSVFVLWGEAGDPIVQLLHLKPPVESIGPWQIRHDHSVGESEVFHAVDLLQAVRNQRQVGMNTKLAARLLFSADKPTTSEVEKARRRLEALVTAGQLVKLEGHRGRGDDSPTLYFLADRNHESNHADEHR